MTVERRRALLVVGAVVAFAATRLALVWRFPPHMDEGLFAHWAQLGYEDPAQRFLPLAFGNTPMQEWLGMSLISIGIEPLTSLRVLSLLSGLVLLAIVWSLARELGGTPAAAASLLVWVVLPFSLVYGVIGLTDPIVAACFGVALVLQLRLVRKPRLDTALVLGIVWGIGLLTKLTMTSSLWLAPLGLLVFDWRRESLASRLARWIATLLLAGAIAAALYQVLRLSPLYEGADEARDLYFSNHGIREFLDSPGTWIEGNWTSYRLAYRGYLTVPLVLAGAVGAGLAIRRKPALGLFFVGWATLPVLAIVALADGAYVRCFTCRSRRSRRSSRSGWPRPRRWFAVDSQGRRRRFVRRRWSPPSLCSSSRRSSGISGRCEIRSAVSIRVTTTWTTSVTSARVARGRRSRGCSRPFREARASRQRDRGSTTSRSGCAGVRSRSRTWGRASPHRRSSSA
jgi:hypothetical protein